MSATIIEKENNNKISEKRKIFNIIYKIKDKKKNKRLRVVFIEVNFVVFPTFFLKLNKR